MRIVATSKNREKMSNKEIASHLGIPVTMVEHWFRKDKCFSVPDPEIWFALKELLDIQTDKFDECVMTFELKDNLYDQSNRIYDEIGLSPTVTCTGADLMILVRRRS